MENIFYEGQIIWSMTDANGHLRHSAYADLAAQARLGAMDQIGLTKALFKQKIGPILFREELVYLRELRLSEQVKVSAEIIKIRPDYSRFYVKSTIYRASDGTKCAEVTVETALLDLTLRKIATAPEDTIPLFNQLPKSVDFVIEEKK